MSGFYVGPLGGMVPLAVAPAVQIETTRAVSEFVSSGGVRYVQHGRRAPRAWTVSRQWQAPEWVRMLSLAAHGLLGECWLYDVAAARDNMVPTDLAAGAGALVSVGDVQLPALTAGHTVRVPVLAGRFYSVSAWQEADAPMLTYQLGTQAAQVLRSTSGSGSASFTPSADQTLTVTITGAATTGLRVNEGPFTGRFFPGHGTPTRVVVADPERTLQLVTAETRSDYTATLTEVGKPGTL